MTLTEARKIGYLFEESNGILTENILDRIKDSIKKKFSKKDTEDIKQSLSDNLGIDENSSVEEIEEKLREETEGKDDFTILKKVLKEVAGFGAMALAWEIQAMIGAGIIKFFDYSPIAIAAVVIYTIYSVSENWEKIRRKGLGKKVDQFIFGKRSHLGDYDDKNKKDEEMNESRKKIIRLTESDLARIVKRVIKEQAQGESEFIQTIVDEYDISDELKNEIINTIKNSECKNVVFEKIAMGDGLSVHNKVIINPITLNYSLGKFLFVIFHELAHQYQFKKYGIEKMLELYNDESDLKEGAEFMMSVEKVADEFASRKLRSLERKGLIELNPSDISTTNKRINLGMLEHMISMFKSQLKRNNIKSPEEISEFLYNMVRIR